MNRCNFCRNISTCPACSRSAADFLHVGVRGTSSHVRIPVIDYKLTYDTQPSGVWHYARPCGHRIYPTATSSIVKYNGGPLWQDGYTWQNVYWGSYYGKPAASHWIKRLELATTHLESDNSYSGGLRQYNVGTGKLIGPVNVQQDPSSQLSNDQIKKALTDWITAGTVADLTTKGAHNNQCTSDPFDTLTQGLSEEMVELKTDMDPGSGWVIGNEEICDYCDTNFVSATG